MDPQRRSDRAQSQEGLYFRRLEEERRRQAQANRTRAALAIELGIGDAAVLDALLAIGLDREKLPAIEWIPLVLVAWADGAVQPAERAAILRAAENDGVAEHHPAHDLLSYWLAEPPRENLLGAWTAYVAALAKRQDESARLAREGWVRDRVREVAEADADWLGLGRVSREEDARIGELARAFGSERSR